MKFFNSVTLLSDPKNRPLLFSFFVTASLIVSVFMLGSFFLGEDNFKILGTTDIIADLKPCDILVDENRHGYPRGNMVRDEFKESAYINKCKDKGMPSGSEALPRGIVSRTSNLEMHPLTGPISENKNSKHLRNLLAIAVGIKQKKLVNQIVKKFLADDFVVMLFHYDGAVNEWKDLEWNDKVIHISAANQTKWWFAKRFLHPDIVAEYDYIFLWDEDLGVENFHPGRYLSTVKKEGLEISQPALDASKSDVHHYITVRRNRSLVHRRHYDSSLNGSMCDGNSIGPPCAGWVEIMAPVFSKAAWRCTWYMVQNDLIHAWGLDMQLGYCAQGDRTVKVGVVDKEYVQHLGLPTLGSVSNKNTTTSNGKSSGNRSAVRQRSYDEMRMFKNRWNNAVEEDKCWVDPYQRRAMHKRN